MDIEHATVVPSDTTLLRSSIESLLLHSLGSHIVLAGLQIVKTRHDYVVLLAHLDRPRLQLQVKLAGPQASYACSFEVTAMVHRLVAERTTIPMPDIVDFDVSLRRWPWRYLVRTHLPGIEWAEVSQKMNAEERDDAGRQMAEAIAQLHEIRFSRFGTLEENGTIQGCVDYLPALTRHASKIISNPRLLDLFVRLLEDRAGDFADVETPCLCHEDLHRHNILFRQEGETRRLATILDFDKAWAGHNESDLARIDFWDDMGGPTFWRTYRAIRNVPPSYERRRAVYQLLWCLEFADSSPRHLADTRRLCAELGIPPIESFD